MLCGYSAYQLTYHEIPDGSVKYCRERQEERGEGRGGRERKEGNSSPRQLLVMYLFALPYTQQSEEPPSCGHRTPSHSTPTCPIIEATLAENEEVLTCLWDLQHQRHKGQ